MSRLIKKIPKTAFSETMTPSVGQVLAWDGNKWTSMTATGGSGGFPTQLGTPVTTMTSAGIQSAINAASPGDTLVLSGTYDCSGGTFEINKKIKLVSYNKAILDGGTGNSMIAKIYSCTGVTISGITFKSQNTASGYALILINEQGPVKDLIITGNEFTAPSGSTFNAITGNAYSQQANNGVYHDNWVITHNYFHDLNRMGIEFNNNATDGTIRFTNLNVSNNTFNNLGTIDGYDGMAISFSGQIQYITCVNNTIQGFKGYGIEFIQAIDFVAVGNNISTTKLFNGSNGSNAYNLTDGGATESNPSRPNIGAHRGSITGGTCNVPGRPFVFYYASDISITGGYWYGGQAVSVQNSKRVSLTGLQVESLYQSSLRIDNSSYCSVNGGRYSTENAVGGKYEQIGFFGNATGNSVVGAALYGTSDNGLNIKQDNGVTGNKWASVFFNGGYLAN